MLRPPTFDNLRRHLESRPGYYHVVHFDGHGGYGVFREDQEGPGYRGGGHTLEGPRGCLVFESEQGTPERQDARQLSALLREHKVPAVVLNACQSATITAAADDAFASVATALLQAGVRNVVAMAYSLYVSAVRRRAVEELARPFLQTH